MKKNIQQYLLAATVVLLAASCQKMDRPALGDFPKDANPPGGPLKFYAAFDGTTADPLMNAVDSIRANFASSNPLTSVDGVSGKGVKGESQKFIRYAKPNDWAKFAKSFTIAFWYKRDGQTKNNTGTNGPEYPVSFKSSNGHWSGANMFVIIEGNNAACAVKVMIADSSNADNWFTWEGGNTIPGLLNNNWRHMALVYSAATSGMTLYIDGVANSNVRVWGTHGDINIDDTKISEMRIGAGPGTNYSSDDWLSSSWKGELDQFRMYDVALSVSEVQALFNGRK
ncbi:MAG: LamG domain-containing protein [Chitinophagaceae bacterium]|nr:LamG domain-containing protein [Chitinophagaceae bacterium]